MTSTPPSDADEHGPVTWDLQSFTINHEFKSSGASRLYLDRANGEFGVVSPTSSAITNLVQFSDDEPIYFSGKNARAASWRGRCKKISLLFEFLQIDLEFAQVDAAHDFLHVVEDITMAAGNHFFYSYEVPS
jgi:histone acetyltransferase HTATIP